MGYSLLSDINGNTLLTKDMKLTPSAEKQLEIKNNKTMSKENKKTFECIEHGEKFLINAKDINEAQEVAQMYGGSVIREVKSS